MNPSYARIYDVVRRIPKGRVCTYGVVARLAGLPRGARRVGEALHALPEGTDLPWQRVVNAQGSVSPRAWGGDHGQRRLLEKEGLRFGRGARVDLWRYGWAGGSLAPGSAGTAGLPPRQAGGDAAADELHWGLADSPFGPALVGRTTQGVCYLAFLDKASAKAEALGELRRRWPEARLVEDPQAAAQVLKEAAQGRVPPLRLSGTPFQVKVWEALRRIPAGGRSSYSELARAIGHPRALRAVGTAVGRNPVAWLVPCHRVLRADGGLGGYRWGPARKRALLDWEASR